MSRGALQKNEKTPSERKQYSVDYSQWLSSGETLTSVTYSVEAEGLVAQNNPLQITDDAILAGTTASYFAEGGDSGETYKVYLTATTTIGQIEEVLIVFSVAEL